VSTLDKPSFDALVSLHATLKSTALALMRISGDMRDLAPCEHSPAQCEALNLVCRQVMGNDAALIAEAATTAPHPTAYQLLQSVRLLTDATTLFTGGLVRGLAVQREHSTSGLANSLMLVTTSRSLRMD
jgi:fumarate hydratase class II